MRRQRWPYIKSGFAEWTTESQPPGPSQQPGVGVGGLKSTLRQEAIGSNIRQLQLPLPTGAALSGDTCITMGAEEAEHLHQALLGGRAVESRAALSESLA